MCSHFTQRCRPARIYRNAITQAEQITHSSASIILLRSPCAMYHSSSGRALKYLITSHRLVLCIFFQNTYWVIKHFLISFLKKIVFIEKPKIYQNPFLNSSHPHHWFGSSSLLKVTCVVICIHCAINKYKLSHLQEKGTLNLGNGHRLGPKDPFPLNETIKTKHDLSILLPSKIRLKMTVKLRKCTT